MHSLEKKFLILPGPDPERRKLTLFVSKKKWRCKGDVGCEIGDVGQEIEGLVVRACESFLRSARLMDGGEHQRKADKRQGANGKE